MMPQYDELLEDDDDAQAFEAEPEPVFDPEFDENSGVVVVEPPIISIGRAKRREHLRKLQEESEQP